MKTLYNDLMKLCAENEAFYHVDHTHEGINYRVFSYRLASYSDFLLPGALECRGHTFRLVDGEAPVLVSLTMEKFFNVNENPFTTDLDWTQVVTVEEKLDGSLISTVALPSNDSRKFFLKSKTSLSSVQAKAAMALMESDAYAEFRGLCSNLVQDGYTVNMEYTAPDNQIVIGYAKPQLRVLNARHNETGEYISIDGHFPEEFTRSHMAFEEFTAQDIANIYEQTGIEGFVLVFSNGQRVKIKTTWYSNLHLQKEQVTNPRRLFESVINEESDDLKSLFVSDPVSVMRIEEMEKLGREIYNRLHKMVIDFHEANQQLDRKSYAIKGQQELTRDGVFSLAMNLYLGKEMGLKHHLIKNYKTYGIVDTSTTE